MATKTEKRVTRTLDCVIEGKTEKAGHKGPYVALQVRGFFKDGAPLKFLETYNSWDIKIPEHWQLMTRHNLLLEREREKNEPAEHPIKDYYWAVIGEVERDQAAPASQSLPAAAVASGDGLPAPLDREASIRWMNALNNAFQMAAAMTPDTVLEEFDKFIKLARWIYATGPEPEHPEPPAPVDAEVDIVDVPEPELASRPRGPIYCTLHPDRMVGILSGGKVGHPDGPGKFCYVGDQ
jgi:hypothetical protein